jgi:hypothetical protein
MSRQALLFIVAALGFYNVGTITAHELDIFRNWRRIEHPDEFRRVQTAHWRKLPYWVFTPVALQMIGSIVLIPYHPAGSPILPIWTVPLAQVASLALTGVFWGRWQAKLSRDPRGAQSRWLDKIVGTHWIRTLLINLAGFALLAWVLVLYA